MDHVLAKEFYKRPEEWPGVEKKVLAPYLNTLGNMALLTDVKNLEALNYGIGRKKKIYKGEDRRETGYVPFETTNWVIKDWENGEYEGNANEVAIARIEARKEALMTEIEKLLEISR